MYSFDVKYRVTYSDTDMMGYLYYGNYARLYEIGRVETMRSLGILYKELEEVHKIMMPVVSVDARFYKPAKYDELLTVRTILEDIPTKLIVFKNEIFNSENVLIHSAIVKLFFIEMNSNTRISCPEWMAKMIKLYF
ncbi:MAG: acyl-CoA thioesterase [Saprospiraceae bacterium]|jgi:acyl-CoA thioester hydrolase|nr:acyl-CoA thioesterase [Saprospiraceae bacterium]MBK6565746.1 acyl-CoA thioesterase [Saprospiraceae bacterium]MBK7525218.1 acyl-CoA thioesterase [Saprospiraceae bacterium]MBK8082170.1 acyl-CoA thioesterase [Saprospiraceae bacterium]MBK8370242.1 acyl-CoA thioesterase [Saprospiraceae bacterium]